MSTILVLCAVVVTVAIATIAVVMLRAVQRFEASAIEFNRTAEAVRSSVQDAQAVMRQVQDLTTAFEQVVPRLQAIAAGAEHLGQRAFRLSNGILDEVERPIHDTLAVLAGVRTGARVLVGALVRRARHAETNGGNPHE